MKNTWMIPHNMQEEWLEVCSNNGRNLIDAAKHYLRKKYSSHAVEGNGQLEVFDMATEPSLFGDKSKQRGLVRLTREASCTKGIGRENITTSKFFPHFDFYLKPELSATHFILTREEQ